MAFQTASGTFRRFQGLQLEFSTVLERCRGLRGIQKDSSWGFRGFSVGGLRDASGGYRKVLPAFNSMSGI